MKTCEAIEGTVYQIIGHRLNWGPIKVLPILGPEVSVEDKSFRTQIILEEDPIYESGILAEMRSSQVVDVYSFDGVARGNQPLVSLVGRQINRHRWTKHHLRWVKEGLNSYIEAAQQPGSTL